MIPIIPIVALSIVSSVVYVNYSYDNIVYGSIKNKRNFLKGEITLNKEEAKEEAAVEEETKLEKVEGEIVEKDKNDIVREYENSAPIKKKDIGPNSPFTIIPEEETHAPKFDSLKEEGKKMSELDNVVEEKPAKKPAEKVVEEPENVVEEKIEEKPAKKPTTKKTTTKAKSTTEKKTTKKTTTKKSENVVEEKVEEKPAKKPAAKKTDTKKTTKKSEKE